MQRLRLTECYLFGSLPVSSSQYFDNQYNISWIVFTIFIVHGALYNSPRSRDPPFLSTPLPAWYQQFQRSVVKPWYNNSMFKHTSVNFLIISAPFTHARDKFFCVAHVRCEKVWIIIYKYFQMKNEFQQQFGGLECINKCRVLLVKPKPKYPPNTLAVFTENFGLVMQQFDPCIPLDSTMNGHPFLILS